VPIITSSSACGVGTAAAAAAAAGVDGRDEALGAGDAALAAAGALFSLRAAWSDILSLPSDDILEIARSRPHVPTDRFLSEAGGVADGGGGGGRGIASVRPRVARTRHA